MAAISRLTVGQRLYTDRQCRATILKRDTYRYTGRGRNGFEMHYTERQCRRHAGESGYCWQHTKRG